MKTLLVELWLFPRNLAIAFMHAYRKFISPLYGEVCRYYPSCSRYALETYQQRGLVVGVVMTTWRLLRCNPLSSGGIDDVHSGLRRNRVINTRGFVRPTQRKA